MSLLARVHLRGSARSAGDKKGKDFPQIPQKTADVFAGPCLSAWISEICGRKKENVSRRSRRKPQKAHVTVSICAKGDIFRCCL
jgi:hypothetical protein